VLCLLHVAAAGNVVMLLMWLVWAGLLAYTQSSMASLKPFDPFEILNVPRDASDRDIKKAYRKLSLVYHPDKVRRAAHSDRPGALMFAALRSSSSSRSRSSTVCCVLHRPQQQHLQKQQTYVSCFVFEMSSAIRSLMSAAAGPRPRLLHAPCGYRPAAQL
jgi:hypothetical protein